MDVLRIDWADPAAEHVARICDALAGDGVVALPTDTVYGLAQSTASNPSGVGRIFSIKRRDHAKAVAWLVAGPDALDVYGRGVPGWARALADTLWPGGLTLVVAASDRVPRALAAAEGTIALRMPAAPVVLRVVRALGCPLATTSANTSGLPAPASAAQLEPRIAAAVDLVVDDGLAHAGVASTVVDCTAGRPVIVREGAIDAQTIALVTS